MPKVITPWSTTWSMWGAHVEKLEQDGELHFRPILQVDARRRDAATRARQN